MKVSVLILAFNEAQNLPRCLSSLDWCDDVVVVDSGSTDGSQEIAMRYGARVITRSFDNFAEQRNFGLMNGNLRHDWVLHLDADEVSTAAFRQAIETLDESSDVDGYFVPSKLMFANRWLKYASNFPVYQARIGHKERFRFIQVGHGQREHPSARMQILTEPYLHYNFSHGLQKWFEKHIRYAADEVDQMNHDGWGIGKVESTSIYSRVGSRRRFKRFLNAVPYAVRPVLRFGQIYLWNQGFRDGRAGFTYAIMVSIYEGMIAVLAYEQMLAGLDASSEKPGRAEGFCC
jgi:glycosyltransferase involved in cell wall biosynthesis